MKLLPEQVMTTYSGNVFDIKRFAMHDGAGIRTTIFLKGCPLRCVWCQNPEGLSIHPQILYMESKCIHCHTCATLSKDNGIQLKNDKLCIQRNAKEDWQTITRECPTGAICYDSKVYTLEEVMKEIRKDEAFFRYGGEVTISGGEPLLQSDFAYEILKACKKEGIHTTIETSLYASLETIQKLLPYLDHIYADVKLFDNDQHKAYTGVDNTRIKENVRYLLKHKKGQVIIRTPLIPNITATKENISQIARFLSDIDSEVQYELLNYNPLAQAKYDYLDMKYCFEDNPKLYTKEEMEDFYKLVKENGVINLIKE